MLFFENILLAINGLKANKMRSLLTMLGIIIGIASVIAIISVGDALTSSTVESMSVLGATRITVGIRQRTDEENEDNEDNTFYFGAIFDKNLTEGDMLTPEMIKDIYDNFSDRLVGMRLENSVGDGVIQRKSKETKVKLSGMNNDALSAKRLKMVSGRLFTDKDQEQAKKVVLISDRAVDQSLKTGYDEALGQELTVLINGEFHHFTIVGVYHFDENSLSYALDGGDATSLYLPVSTSFREMHKNEVYQSVDYEFAEGVDTGKLLKDIDAYVNDKYYRNNRNFEVASFSEASLVEELGRTLQSISIGISVIAAISLLVGGIGVMNIMLVSIQERTKEIGTRKALGATNSSIRMQFIVESIVLCIVGGFIGVLIGIGMGYLGVVAINGFGSSEADAAESAIKYVIPYKGMLIALLFSAGVGVFFGYYPANKAAKMNPIDALRYE